MTDTTTNVAGVSALAIRRVRRADIPDVIALDERVTGFAKPDYWHDQFARYGERRAGERFFLVAQAPLDRCEGAEILGFIIGEVRAWEFGSPPCGWVFALSVRPGARLHGIGQMLLQAIAAEPWWRATTGCISCSSAAKG